MRRREYIQTTPIGQTGAAHVTGVWARTAVGSVIASAPMADALALQVGRVSARGVQNPTDEELVALLVAVL